MPKSPQKHLVLSLILLFVFGMSQLSTNAEREEQFFLDDGGRHIQLPPTVKSIYATTEEGLFLLYSLDPTAILGWNRGLSPELEFAVLPEYHDLPTLGSWNMEYQTIKKDLVLSLKPDLILHYAPIDQENIALATEIEHTLGLPTILIDNSLTELASALTLIGELLDKGLRGQALAKFTEQHLAHLDHFQTLQATVRPIPVHIVSPSPVGHFNESLTLAGMVEMPTWQDQPPFPDLVLIQPHILFDPYRAIEKDGHKRIYQIPNFPKSWLEPGSIFTLLGLEWLHSIGYPTLYKGELYEFYQAFMEMFFQINLTPELLTWTLKRSGISY